MVVMKHNYIRFDVALYFPCLDSTSDNQLIEDVAIPATIVSVTVLLCITVIIVVTIIVVGVVCCVKRTKNSYKGDSEHTVT